MLIRNMQEWAGISTTLATAPQSVPEFVEIAGEPAFEILDRLSVYSSRSLVGLHTFKCFPDFPLRNVERLCVVRRLRSVFLPSGSKLGKRRAARVRTNDIAVTERRRA
jgi:hypothetical protein